MGGAEVCVTATRFSRIPQLWAARFRGLAPTATVMPALRASEPGMRWGICAEERDSWWLVRGDWRALIDRQECLSYFNPSESDIDWLWKRGRFLMAKIWTVLRGNEHGW
jgi:hypothetical protein